MQAKQINLKLKDIAQQMTIKRKRKSKFQINPQYKMQTNYHKSKLKMCPKMTQHNKEPQKKKMNPKRRK